MAASVRVTKVVHSLGSRVRIAKVSFFGTPNGPNARARVTRVMFEVPGADPAQVRVTRAVFFVVNALDGTPLLCEFDGTTWVPIQGELVMFDGAAWVSC